MEPSDSPGDTIAAVGPYPDLSIAALRELGMTRAAVARYFRIAPRAVEELERGDEDKPGIEEKRP